MEHPTRNAAAAVTRLAGDPLSSGLFTDLYELKMAQAYHARAMDGEAVFEIHFRSLPPQRRFVVAAGLEDVLEHLEGWRVAPEEIDWLRQQGDWAEDFLEHLGRLRFTGDVHALPEGTLVFPGEPILQVVAPLSQGQLVETLVLQQVHFQSVLASKAARVVLAADGRDVIDFGARRCHGGEAAMKSARCAWLVGAAGTSLVAAGRRYGIPIFGTMAHSYVLAHDDESAALETFARQYPETTLLVDTYDTLESVRRVIALCREHTDLAVGALRLDSGDLEALSVATRALLDEAGLEHVRIFVSGGLDEHQIARLVRCGAPIDGFGVGTRMGVSADAPHLDMAYKLVEYEGRSRMKLSTGKVHHPGRKQIFRTTADGGSDVVGRAEETLSGEPLLQTVMTGGVRTAAGRTSLAAARQRVREQWGRFPPELRHIDGDVGSYPVQVSPALAELAERTQLKERQRA